MRYNLTELKRYVTIIVILNIGPTILGETRDKSQILFLQRCNNAILIIQTCTTHSCSADAKLLPGVYATPLPSKEEKKKRPDDDSEFLLSSPNTFTCLHVCLWAPLLACLQCQKKEEIL